MSRRAATDRMLDEASGSRSSERVSKVIPRAVQSTLATCGNSRPGGGAQRGPDAGDGRAATRSPVVLGARHRQGATGGSERRPGCFCRA